MGSNHNKRNRPLGHNSRPESSSTLQLHQAARASFGGWWPAAPVTVGAAPAVASAVASVHRVVQLGLSRTLSCGRPQSVRARKTRTCGHREALQVDCHIAGSLRVLPPSAFVHTVAQ